jgi:hypothetical protein
MMMNSRLSVNPDLAFVISASDPDSKEIDASRVTSWAHVLDLAIHHRVYPRVAQHALDSFPRPEAATLRSRAQKNAQTALRNVARTCEVSSHLAAESVESIVLKGPILARDLYGDFAMRVSGDIDLLVRESDFVKAALALQAAGYRHERPLARTALTRLRRWSHDVAFVHPEDGSLLELHADIAQPHYGYRFNLSEWWTKKRQVQVGSTSLWVLSGEHGYLLAAAHAAKHRWERLDLICDMAVYRRKPLDWAAVYAEAAESWMLRAMRVGEGLAAGFYGSGPLRCGSESEAAEKLVAGERFGKWDGAMFDFDLRERRRDRFAYVGRRLLSAMLRV